MRRNYQGWPGRVPGGPGGGAPWRCIEVHFAKVGKMQFKLFSIPVTGDIEVGQTGTGRTGTLLVAAQVDWVKC